MEGLIDSDADEHKVRKDIASAANELGSESTPFGPIVQTMTFNTTPPFHWRYIHPLALLYKLSTIAEGFVSLLKSCVDAYGELSIVLYVDDSAWACTQAGLWESYPKHILDFRRIPGMVSEQG